MWSESGGRFEAFSRSVVGHREGGREVESGGRFEALCGFARATR